ncbi:PDZ domain-containing protein [Rhizobium sp. P40RR-XXII]|uniref:PDZ domain-containing protein n=1 Tax=Rhizobium sp. P40RR-XXII TaxID=2726739 RepID=UPI001456CB28|nr:PDZ domain-containing protein [Rhizobium sp. P40RR-XXII]
MNTATGALVSDVISGSGGAIAGIKAGDVIIAVNEFQSKALTNSMHGYQPSRLMSPYGSHWYARLER